MFWMLVDMACKCTEDDEKEKKKRIFLAGVFLIEVIFRNRCLQQI